MFPSNVGDVTRADGDEPLCLAHIGVNSGPTSTRGWGRDQPHCWR
jgi:hypothetical protein